MPDAVRALAEHVARLQSPENRLLTIYKFEHLDPHGKHDETQRATLLISALDRLQFSFRMLETELLESEGTQVIIKDSVVTWVVPDRVISDQAQRLIRRWGSGWKRWTDGLRATTTRRREAFRLRAGNGARYRELYGKPGIEALVRDGIVASDDWMDEPLEPHERREVLEALVALIEEFDSFEVGLLEKAPPMYWMVKDIPGGDATAFVEIFLPSQAQTSHGCGATNTLVEQDIVVTDGSAAAALLREFDRYWALPSTVTDKAQVIKYLRDILEGLPEVKMRDTPKV